MYNPDLYEKISDLEVSIEYDGEIIFEMNDKNDALCSFRSGIYPKVHAQAGPVIPPKVKNATLLRENGGFRQVINCEIGNLNFFLPVV